jgi:hypothetical protein
MRTASAALRTKNRKKSQSHFGRLIRDLTSPYFGNAFSIFGPFVPRVPERIGGCGLPKVFVSFITWPITASSEIDSCFTRLRDPLRSIDVASMLPV